MTRGHEGRWQPAPLVGRQLSLNDATLRDHALIEAKIRELGELGFGFERFFLRLEAMASSGLSGLLVSPYDVALGELDEEKPLGVAVDPVARAVVRHVGALRAANDELARAPHITVAGIDHVQRLLLADEPQQQGFRDSQMWVGGPGPVGAGHVPPPLEYVADLMADLAAYLNTDEHPVLVQAALAYAQLEQISPFRAGNGRVGRALIAAVLRRRGPTPAYVLPVSVRMFADRMGCEWVLQRSVYEGSPSSEAAREATDAWVNRFMSPPEAAVHTVRSMVADLHRLREGWREAVSRVRDGGRQRPSDEVVGQAIALLPERLLLTPAVAAADLRISLADAQAVLDLLAAAGAVGPSMLRAELKGYWAVGALEMVEEAVRPTSETRSPRPGWPLNYAGVPAPPR